MSSAKSLSAMCTLSDDLIPYYSGSIPVPSSELNLRQTLHGGQSFRYICCLLVFSFDLTRSSHRWIEQPPDEFIGSLSSYIIRLKHVDEQLIYTFYTHTQLPLPPADDTRQSETSQLLHDYFQLTVRLSDLVHRWSEADERFRSQQIPAGIRVLAQDPLENLISFICSSNNNVQRISKMIKSLCDEYGTRIGAINGTHFHRFPTLSKAMDGPFGTLDFRIQTNSTSPTSKSVYEN